MNDRPTRGPGLVLVGYRGTGKSTIGRVVAERAGCPFADADAEFERAVGRPIRVVFAEEGEGGFRLREAALLESLVDAPELAGGVLATGGGAVLAESNRRALRRFGLVVWLTADAETLARRLANSRNPLADRPALTAAGTVGEVAAVLEARLPVYRAAADVEVASAGRSVGEVVESVLGIWHARPGPAGRGGGHRR